MIEGSTPEPRQVDKLSAEIETICHDWRRMRAVIERIAKLAWWDLHTLCCQYCHAPFDIAEGTCVHQVDCVYERCCEIMGMQPLPLPHQAILSEWQRKSPANLSL